MHVQAARCMLRLKLNGCCFVGKSVVGAPKILRYWNIRRNRHLEERLTFMAQDREIGEVSHNRKRFEWRIPDFTVYQILDERFEGRYLSKDFAFDGNMWYLEILPNVGTSQYVDISLHRSNDSFAQRVKVALGVRKREVCDRSEFLAQGTDCWGQTHLFLKSDLRQHENRYLVHGAMSIFCSMWSEDIEDDEVNLDRKEEENLDEKSYDLLRQHLGAMRVSSGDYDVTLKVGGQDFRAHSSILRARSRVFNGMLGHDMAERKSGVVTIDNCDPTTFDTLLQYVYTGTLSELSVENSIPLFRVADMYDFPALRGQCLTFLMDNMCSSVVFDSFQLATLHCEWGLRDRATSFFADHMVEVLEGELWLDFIKAEPKMANGLFQKSMKVLTTD